MASHLTKLLYTKKRPAAAPDNSMATKVAKTTPQKAAAPKKKPQVATPPKAASMPNGGKAMKQLPFPGVPKKQTGAMHHNGFRIYSDLRMGAWRVQRLGDRKDKSCTWRSDAKAAWAKVNLIIAGKA